MDAFSKAERMRDWQTDTCVQKVQETRCMVKENVQGGMIHVEVRVEDEKAEK